MYLLDVLVVIVYMSFCNCWDYLLLHEDWGECSEDWAGACRGKMEFLTEKKKFAKKCSWGLKSFFSLLNFFLKKCSFIIARGLGRVF